MGCSFFLSAYVGVWLVLARGEIREYGVRSKSVECMCRWTEIKAVGSGPSAVIIIMCTTAVNCLIEKFRDAKNEARP